MKVEFKKITILDLEDLKQISQNTFQDAFSKDNSQENMQSYVNYAFNSAKLTTELNEDNSEFYFCYTENTHVGYVKLNFGTAQTDIKANDSMELERIYVLKTFQGKKIGQSILEKVITIGKDRNMNFICLGVWDKNERAIKFYETNKFKVISPHDFILGNEMQRDLVMKLNLK